jgi:O-acetyl-ADP-ribose deacetylase (regulator of RNase III)
MFFINNMVKVIEQDIFEAPIDVLVHQANCFHTMGSGIAKEIRERFPEAYEADLKTVEGSKDKLGTYSHTRVFKHPQIKYIVNMYSQFTYGTQKRQTNYEAMYMCLEDIRLKMTIHGRTKGKFLTLGFPYKIGCNLGGGNWRIVQTMIEEVFADYKGEVLICKKP